MANNDSTVFNKNVIRIIIIIVMMMMMMMMTMIIIDMINNNNNKFSDVYRTSPLFLAVL